MGNGVRGDRVGERGGRLGSEERVRSNRETRDFYGIIIRLSFTVYELIIIIN